MPHIRRRISFAVVSKSPAGRLGEFATARGWKHLQLLSAHDCDFQQDYFGEKNGKPMPMANVFQRKDGVISHFWGTEMLYAPTEEGCDPRHMDLMWPLWGVFDVCPEGRGDKFYPTL